MAWFKTNRWWLLLLAVLVLAAYIWTLGFKFLSDDIYGIVDNKQIFSWSWVWQNPLVVTGRLINWLIAHLFGITPWPFRLVNILVHYLAAIGVMVLVSRLIGRTTGILAAVLVAVHPLLIESVTWIAGNGYVWYSMFLIWSLVFYCLAEKKQSWLLLSIGFFFLSLEFSEKAMMFPGILIAYRLLVNKKRGRIWDLLPYFFLSGVWIFLNFRNVGVRLNYLQTEYNAPSVAGMINPLLAVPVAVANYLSLIFWPDKLTLYHSETNPNPTLFNFQAGITAAYLLITVWLVLRRKPAGFWMSWFIIGLSPTLTATMWGAAWLVAERYAYFSALGLLVLIAWGLVKLTQKKSCRDLGWLLISLILTGSPTGNASRPWPNHRGGRKDRPNYCGFGRY